MEFWFPAELDLTLHQLIFNLTIVTQLRVIYSCRAHTSLLQLMQTTGYNNMVGLLLSDITLLVELLVSVIILILVYYATFWDA